MDKLLIVFAPVGGKKEKGLANKVLANKGLS